jgi:hypothetical protein
MSGKEKITTDDFLFFYSFQLPPHCLSVLLARFSHHFLFVFSAGGIVLAFTVCHRLLR